jgi:hypothetical protein
VWYNRHCFQILEQETLYLARFDQDRQAMLGINVAIHQILLVGMWNEAILRFDFCKEA